MVSQHALAMNEITNAALHTTRILVLGSPNDRWSLFLFLWILRLVVFSLLLRTYFVPWLLGITTKHIRIRSISFLSVRGLYLRQGNHTLRVERISWRVIGKFSRVALKVDSLSLEIGEPESEAGTSAPAPEMLRRKFSLKALDPSPILHQIRRLLAALVALFDPIFRPILRHYVVVVLRFAIQWVPRITQRLTFELMNSSVTFAALPGTEITTEQVLFVASLELIETAPTAEALKESLAAESKPSNAMTAFTSRMTDGFKRSLDRAWGSTMGKSKLEFKVLNIQGYMPITPHGRALSFLSLPDPIDLVASMDFNPRAGLMDTNTLELSLTLGDCSAKVDLVSLLLDKLKPKKSSKLPKLVTQPKIASPRFTSFSFPSSAGISASIQSALPSFASSLWSPGGKSGAFSPLSGKMLSPTSLRSPTSPFFRAISASMRPRKRNLVQPTFRLKDAVKASTFAVLRKFEVNIASITLSASRQSPLGPYRGVLRRLHVSSELSHLSRSPHKKRWLGHQWAHEVYDADSYLFTFSLKKMQLERGTRLDSLPLAKIGEQSVHILAHQWPAPLLVVAPFMAGDPNAAFLGVSYKISGVEATQRLDHFQELLNNVDLVRQSSSKATKQKPLAQGPLTLPRVSFSVEIGPVSTKLIFSSNSDHILQALELRTEGCSIHAQSRYEHASPAVAAKYPTSSSVVPVNLQLDYSVYVEPIAVLTRCTADGEEVSGREDPSVLSMGMFEFTGRLHGIAEADGPGGGFAVIDRESISCECSSVIDAICIELWNPSVVDSVHQLLSVIPVKRDAPAPPAKSVALETKASRFHNLPFGLTARGSLGQFVVFVTAPDINPNDTLDLSRGISIRFAGVLECRSLHPSQSHWFDYHPSHEQRSTLNLSNDSLHAEKDSSTTPYDASIFVRLQLLHAIVRSLVATPFEPSEPLLVERVDAPQLPQDMLRVKKVQMDLRISAAPSLSTDSTQEDVVGIKVGIPSIRGDFKLAHIYSALLAVQTVESLQPPRPPTKSGVPVRSRFSFALELDIPTIQIHWTLPKRNVVTRIDNFHTTLSSIGPPTVGFDHASVFVPLPAKVNSWESDRPGRWDELLSLQQWQVFISPLGDSVSIAVQGESAHLRIPAGFVFFDLVFDTTVMIKALKHITHITKAGRFWKMPSPPAEGPKTPPLVNVRLDLLCAEVQDDPFEANLGLIWQAGFEAARQRHEREEAFAAKVAAIMLAEQQAGALDGVDSDYQFTPQHTVPIEEARQRLDKVHVLDWRMRLDRLRSTRQSENEAVLQDLFGAEPLTYTAREPHIVPVIRPSTQHPPLLRLNLENLNMSISPPSFPMHSLSTYLHDQGSGLPKDTEFTLLIPLHLHFSLSAVRATLRDYPIPIMDILPHDDGKTTVWTFDTDLIIGEEMGTEASVLWYDCAVIDQDDTLHGEALWSLKIPKTIMPVKTYANATIRVESPYPTVLAWGISYGSAMQDVMRIVDTLTSPPHDPSPGMGFWDKLRLIMHWTLDIRFSGDVHMYLKGARDPYETHDEGAGFVLGWQGHPRLRIGFANEQKELMQLTSDLMVIAVPDLDYVAPNSFAPHDSRTMGIPKPFKKVWARLNTGIRFGVGFLPERTCGDECDTCSGPPSNRQCRLFDFKPHYLVRMEDKPFIPALKSAEDSYRGFRSDFLHLSFSLESSLKKNANRSSIERDYSSLHLTAKLFANFWAWCGLFNGAMGLPIRQGLYYPPRPISPKLGTHIATLKYRIRIPHLYVMHGYIDNSRETWVDGVTSWVGVKGMVDDLHVDMHQREEETTVPGPIPGTTRTLKHKPFYAAEVVLKGLDLRALLAIFPDQMKKEVPISAPPQRSNYRQHTGLPNTSPTSPWHDPNDFIELDWCSSSIPALHLLPVAMIPRFAYFKRISSTQTSGLTNKFGSEDSHICLLDKEPSVPKVQILLASARAAELRSLIRKAKQRNMVNVSFDMTTAERMVALLEDYVTVLQNLDAGVEPKEADPQTYFLPSDMTSTAEVAEFENVYQIHCPSIFLESSIRDIILQYYYCSRARRGAEYHMATRAVKFIRDQAHATIDLENTDEKQKSDSMADLASATLRKILKSDSSKPSLEIRRETPDVTKGNPDPLDGWAEGVTLNKSHCCLLLKPQFILRGAEYKDTCIVTAGQAKLQAMSIMDTMHMNDPISGKVMSRNYMTLSGLQVYSPLHPQALGNSSIPLEVLIDLRCESAQFERLVPQTDATFHYDKFNRLRLRNTVTTAAAKVCTDQSQADSHLRSQTDLIRVHIPRFTVSANTQHFQAISNVVTKLVLFSDAAHKTRLDRLETLIFAYDFRDLNSAANVISNLQDRLRDAIQTRKLSGRDPKRTQGALDRLSFLKVNAHVFLLEEELSLLFDAIKLSQDRFAASSEQNAALLLHASSSEIAWKMLDERTNLLSKLVVQNIDFNWLNRQDSSTVNHLSVGNLTAFDGSRTAMWAEIISKYDEPSNHPLCKKRLFCLANWTILAPVGGITIYETFELSFHPLRLQIDAKIGKRIMEYVWPDRKDRDTVREVPSVEVKSPVRASVDSPRGIGGFKVPEATLAAPRRLASSRSFTDLRSTTENFLTAPTFLHRNRSSDSLNPERQKQHGTEGSSQPSDLANDFTEATVMKNRSNQKSFVYVKISSLNLLLSISKEGSFECRDARIKTRDLEYRNQTWSFEELVNQFIPSNMSWRGWVKMAFHQPLLPVLPVAKELLSKTRWTSSKATPAHESPFKLLHPRMLVADDDSRLEWLQREGTKLTLDPPTARKRSVGQPSKTPPAKPTRLPNASSSTVGPSAPPPPANITAMPFSSEPESMDDPQDIPSRPAPVATSSRSRVKGLFKRGKGGKGGNARIDDLE